MKIKSLFILNIIVEVILLAAALFLFYIFQPYQFIDHNKTKVICNKNNASYDIGPNLIHILDRKPDSISDKDIRKLCEYSLINDTQDVLRTPEKINYKIAVNYEHEGNWLESFFISLTVYLLLKYLLQNYLRLTFNFKSIKSILVFIACIVFSWIFFFFFLIKPAKQISCERRLASVVNNFKKSAYGFGLKRLQQEDIKMKPILKKAYAACIRLNLQAFMK
ncbi:hypothetical protein A2767_01235 [Candidatus Roizmanbacteria bacterium RIFCSPHIGHO2_01_FULL_35_10]|uniref:Uncharacterized protein n=1 Tax=Candidatus Roizmanbacteria bacterium RIFCSPLOWO2_01_FULL_35_13 TaxID=1802055 RepID=A0A1F7I7P3_9BACT|nr:MAG: hypothetical protein A2767_01235 [Candidatus Roizmanbacteria bacterium RIFCSPHIGHO2_01_FULL_35_10]OGK39386.1 MAG: hypothetical protein A3A74_06140 [Candidatus Roizmanbacteria bacterium RIFCSPLOWO2_01_FULL_35_13]